MYRFVRLPRLWQSSSAVLSSVRTIRGKNNDNFVDDLLGNFLSKEDTHNLKNKVMAMDLDSFNQGVRGQQQETAFELERLMRKMPKDEPLKPSLAGLLHEGTKAGRLLRLEVYSRAISEGLPEKTATKAAAFAVNRAITLFEKKANTIVEDLKKEEQQQKIEKDRVNEKEWKLIEFAFNLINDFFASQQSKKSSGKRLLKFEKIDPNPNAPKVFGQTKDALGYFDIDKKLTPAPTSYWAEMERRKADIVNLSMGPKNAFEEQILWTNQGRMWPYPIDNEYLIGEEANVSFTEHIFLDRYLAKKHPHIPKTGPVGHFMELVCVGLSKNPYMTVAKKHMHLDSFAEFFSPDQIKKVHKMHEEAERQAATA